MNVELGNGAFISSIKTTSIQLEVKFLPPFEKVYLNEFPFSARAAP